MGDADAAQWNAVQEVFESDTDLRFLMCYFHVAKKVYEKTGFATTNNPCETYNAAIKRDVTLRRKLKVGALIDQVLKLCQSESVRAKPFVVDPSPDARLVRRAKAMQREGLLLERPAACASIAFLLEGEISDDETDVVRVTSQQCAHVFDEVLRTTVDDMPITAQLTRLTAEMERRGMLTNGWAVNVVSRSCPCRFWLNSFSIILLMSALPDTPPPRAVTMADGVPVAISMKPLPSIKPFFTYCISVLKANKVKRRIDKATARYLHQCAIIAPVDFQDWGGVVQRVMLAVDRYKITKSALAAVLANPDHVEVEWVLPAGIDQKGLPTYYLKRILASKKEKNGKVLYLTDWEPTWEPISNLPMAEVRKFQKKRRRLTEKAYIETEAASSS
ncbi:hypothetical protein BBJ28_00019572 [Nothophytophthora sp. Chile5]|nr:hypothetical protein BBJ28_00019572 [Nothophytophthora sp. Chile5]